MQAARVTIFAGHYGSGKTTLAVNYALALAQRLPRVALCDMDIVNPYFRTADSAQVLAQGGVELISSPYANTNVEMPWAPVDAQRALDQPGLVSVIDLGGDDSGALALGRYAARLAQLREAGELAVWMVVNTCRPLTGDAEALREVKAEIEAAAHIPFTGLINNTNLGEETTPDVIEGSFPLVEELSAALALPVVMTAVRTDIPLDVPPGMGDRFDITRYGNRFSI